MRGRKRGGVSDSEMAGFVVELMICRWLGGFAIAGCTPTVKVEVPNKPIEINLNINMKIEQNVRVRMEKELDKAIQENPGIF